SRGTSAGGSRSRRRHSLTTSRKRGGTGWRTSPSGHEQRHHTAFEAIRREHDDVVAALKTASRSKKKGAPGTPAYDPALLEAAIATAGDAYALLLIATAEGFLREYLQSAGVVLPPEPRLSMLIDRSFKELNERS